MCKSGIMITRRCHPLAWLFLLPPFPRSLIRIDLSNLSAPHRNKWVVIHVCRLQNIHNRRFFFLFFFAHAPGPMMNKGYCSIIEQVSQAPLVLFMCRETQQEQLFWSHPSIPLCRWVLCPKLPIRFKDIFCFSFAFFFTLTRSAALDQE